MKPSNKPYANDSDSENSNSSAASIPRYGGYKHSSSRYEDFEMWNSVCEDAEPGWEYKESQRQERKQRRQAKKEAEKEIAVARRKEKTAKAATSQTSLVAPIILGLGSPFDYQRSKYAAQHCIQDLAKITHDDNNAKEKNAILNPENDGPETEHDTQSCRGLTFEEALDSSRPDNVKTQSRPASGARTCTLM